MAEELNACSNVVRLVATGQSGADMDALFVRPVSPTVPVHGDLEEGFSTGNYEYTSFLGAGLTVGMSSLAADLAISIVGDTGVRASDVRSSTASD